MKDITKPCKLIGVDTDICLFHIYKFSDSLDLKKLADLVSAT